MPVPLSYKFDGGGYAGVDKAFHDEVFALCQRASFTPRKGEPLPASVPVRVSATCGPFSHKPPIRAPRAGPCLWTNAPFW